MQEESTVECQLCHYQPAGKDLRNHLQHQHRVTKPTAVDQLFSLHFPASSEAMSPTAISLMNELIPANESTGNNFEEHCEHPDPELDAERNMIRNANGYYETPNTADESLNTNSNTMNEVDELLTDSEDIGTTTFLGFTDEISNHIEHKFDFSGFSIRDCEVLLKRKSLDAVEFKNIKRRKKDKLNNCEQDNGKKLKGEKEKNIRMNVEKIKSLQKKVVSQNSNQMKNIKFKCGSMVLAKGVSINYVHF